MRLWYSQKAPRIDVDPARMRWRTESLYHEQDNIFDIHFAKVVRAMDGYAL